MTEPVVIPAAPSPDPATARRALITGARGTVGQALTAHLAAAGWDPLAWDRGVVPPGDYAAMEAYVRASGARVLFHLAVASQPTGRANEGWAISYEWTSELAWICRVLGLRFVFISTAMVFTDAARGPFTPDSVPDAHEGYGFEKRSAEERVRHQHPEAIIARLGWQLASRGDNRMQLHLERQMAEHGAIRASTRWLPACSFADDTAAALRQLAETGAPGTYLLDSNERWTFFEIARAIAAAEARPWNVVATDDFVYDQRMQDPRAPLPSLRLRLPTLP